jgi:Asp-tRNA(Asn)/Glu-tRNA(Gln) amidotransferase A subunit family amidase
MLALSGIQQRTAPVVQQLLDAGARFAGKTITDELAYSMNGQNAHFGSPINGADPLRISGGSSSGSASAVSNRLCDFALGSDTGGSIRAPAAMCGVTGLKPTWGRVPRTGAMPLCHSLDTIGPIARSAEDCARLLALIAGPDGHDPLLQQPAPGFESLLRAPAGGLRLGVARAFIDAAEPAVADAMNAAVQCFRALGVTLVEVPSAVFDLPHLDALSAHAMLVLQAESSAQHAARLRGEENADRMRPATEGSNHPEFMANNAGGIAGGISTGQPVLVRVAFKPTSSILTPVETVTRDGDATDIVTKGRHDPCVGIRGTPVVEAMMALVLADQKLLHRAQCG